MKTRPVKPRPDPVRGLRQWRLPDGHLSRNRAQPIPLPGQWPLCAFWKPTLERRRRNDDGPRFEKKPRMTKQRFHPAQRPQRFHHKMFLCLICTIVYFFFMDTLRASALPPTQLLHAAPADCPSAIQSKKRLIFFMKFSRIDGFGRCAVLFLPIVTPRPGACRPLYNPEFHQ